MGIFKPSKEKPIPFQNFDLQQRYDFYFKDEEGFAAIDNVAIKGRRTFDPIPEDGEVFSGFFEVVDESDRTLFVDMNQVAFLATAGTPIRLRRISS